MSMSWARQVTLGAVALTALGLTACGGSEDEASAPSATSNGSSGDAGAEPASGVAGLPTEAELLAVLPDGTQLQTPELLALCKKGPEVPTAVHVETTEGDDVEALALGFADAGAAEKYLKSVTDLINSCGDYDGEFAGYRVTPMGTEGPGIHFVIYESSSPPFKKKDVIGADVYRMGQAGNLVVYVEQRFSSPPISSKEADKIFTKIYQGLPGAETKSS